jgi:diguanylate cyclase (GGDEF)-like protein/PAS domain S-box-containing protein
MIPGKVAFAGDAGSEVSALIQTLHETGQRLEELTAGEVDTVADREGRTFVLRTSQEQLRYIDATRQAALLNALPAHIALLDPRGFIVSVNEAWSKFAGGNTLQGPGHGMGVNYLEVCDAARGNDASETRQVAAGIRGVLNATAKSFSLEYPCHSPVEERWFLLMVTPLAHGHPHGAVVMHLDVTAERKAKESLRESERRFSEMLANVDMISVMLDTEGRITYCNEYLLRVTGWAREELIGKKWFEVVIPSDAEGMPELFASLLANEPEAWHHENEIMTRTGERRLIRWNNSILQAGSVVVGTASIGEDITEQKHAEIRIKRLNRVYAMLSQINALIVRVGSREELFNEACRIAVAVGGFKMAWVGMIDPQTLDGKVVAWYGGAEDYIDIVRLTTREGTPDSERPACRALRDSLPVIANDVASDPSLVTIRDELLRRGHQSLGSFPLTIAGRSQAVITFFAGEPGVFDDEETRLLTELAGNISFALDHLEKGERLDYLAYYDALTGLANRTLFLDRVAQYMRSAGSGGHRLALYLIDLERFKNINDSFGQTAGDGLLKQVSEWLIRNVGDANLVARVGADHFAVVLPEVSEVREVGGWLDETLAAFLDHPFHLNDAVFRIAAKAGVALFPDDGANADTLFKKAEAALKNSKASGDRYLFYTQKMTELVAGKLTLENQLRQALERQEFVLHYQPKVNLASGKLTGAEALIRWNDPHTGLVPPGRFIPILEETGLIHEVGRWALHQAIEEYLRWRKAGLPALRIAVNVSALQLRNRGFVAEIRQLIGIDAHAAAGLELEITESVIMQDVKHNIASLQAIRAMGVTIAVDDFGTGFSSLSYLSKLPVDTLKIDRSFVVDLTAGPEGLALVSTIINLAHSLKLKVVAEGVETEEQSRLLRLLNCDDTQGFLFSKPVPAATFEERDEGAHP